MQNTKKKNNNNNTVEQKHKVQIHQTNYKLVHKTKKLKRGGRQSFK